MIRAVLVLAWYTCAIPAPDRPCVEIETKAYSSILEAVRGYHQGVDALDRHLYFIGDDQDYTGVKAIREYGYGPGYGKVKISGRLIEGDKEMEDDFEAILDEAVGHTDAKACIKGLRSRDALAIGLFCKKDCDTLANLSTDIEMTEKVRDFVFAAVKKCRTDRQERAFNRLVCGQDKCP